MILKGIFDTRPTLVRPLLGGYLSLLITTSVVQNQKGIPKLSSPKGQGLVILGMPLPKGFYLV
jgi:hypothetical protein